ncbi:hypothetical protein ACOME3_001383 [Neoechinorhynchus agilis]
MDKLGWIAKFRELGIALVEVTGECNDILYVDQSVFVENLNRFLFSIDRDSASDLIDVLFYSTNSATNDFHEEKILQHLLPTISHPSECVTLRGNEQDSFTALLLSINDVHSEMKDKLVMHFLRLIDWHLSTNADLEFQIMCCALIAKHLQNGAHIRTNAQVDLFVDLLSSAPSQILYDILLENYTQLFGSSRALDRFSSRLSTMYDQCDESLRLFILISSSTRPSFQWYARISRELELRLEDESLSAAAISSLSKHEEQSQLLALFLRQIPSKPNDKIIKGLMNKTFLANASHTMAFISFVESSTVKLRCIDLVLLLMLYARRRAHHRISRVIKQLAIESIESFQNTIVTFLSENEIILDETQITFEAFFRLFIQQFICSCDEQINKFGVWTIEACLMHLKSDEHRFKLVEHTKAGVDFASFLEKKISTDVDNLFFNGHSRRVLLQWIERLIGASDDDDLTFHYDLAWCLYHSRRTLSALRNDITILLYCSIVLRIPRSEHYRLVDKISSDQRVIEEVCSLLAIGSIPDPVRHFNRNTFSLMVECFVECTSMMNNNNKAALLEQNHKFNDLLDFAFSTIQMLISSNDSSFKRFGYVNCPSKSKQSIAISSSVPCHCLFFISEYCRDNKRIHELLTNYLVLPAQIKDDFSNHIDYLNSLIYTMNFFREQIRFCCKNINTTFALEFALDRICHVHELMLTINQFVDESLNVKYRPPVVCHTLLFATTPSGRIEPRKKKTKKIKFAKNDECPTNLTVPNDEDENTRSALTLEDEHRSPLELPLESLRPIEPIHLLRLLSTDYSHITVRQFAFIVNELLRWSKTRLRQLHGPPIMNQYTVIINDEENLRNVITSLGRLEGLLSYLFEEDNDELQTTLISYYNLLEILAKLSTSFEFDAIKVPSLAKIRTFQAAYALIRFLSTRSTTPYNCLKELCDGFMRREWNLLAPATIYKVFGKMFAIHTKYGYYGVSFS